MQAGWFRLKYPNLIHAAVASSAPGTNGYLILLRCLTRAVHAVANFYGYNDVVGESMAAPIVGGSDACALAIKTAFEVSGC